MKKNNKIILFLLLFFLFIRIGTAIFAGQKELEKDADTISYNDFATAVLQNKDWITDPDFEGNHRPPLYPMFIAAIYSIFGIGNFLAVYIFQAILSTLTCFYIYKLSKKIFNEKVALLSFIWSGFYIFHLHYLRLLYREILVYFLIIIFFYYLYLWLADENRKSRNFWLSIVFYSLLIHTDPRYLFYLPFFVFLFVIYQSFNRGLKNIFIFLLMTILFMSPWTVRNYLAYKGFILINTRTLDLRPKNKRNSTFDYQIKKNVLGFGVYTDTKNKEYPTEEERKLIKQGLNPTGRRADELEAIKNDVYPASTFFKRKLFALIELWRPARFSYAYFPFPDTRFQKKWSLEHNISGILCYGILLPFMLLGIFYLIRQKNKIAIFLIFPILIQTLLHVLLWANERYRIPIDAFIIILASYGLFWICNKFKERRLKYN